MVHWRKIAHKRISEKNIRTNLTMEERFNIAQINLEDKPVCTSCLLLIYPMIKNSDFSNGLKLEIPMPTHTISSINKNFEYERKTVPMFSHKTIRRCLRLLWLEPSFKKRNEGILIIQKYRPKKKS